MRGRKIGNLHCAIRCEQDIRGLDIPVDHALRMRIVERKGAAENNLHCLRYRQQRSRLAELSNGLATLDQLHHDVQPAIINAGIEDFEDILVPQYAGRMRFIKKLLAQLCIDMRVFRSAAQRHLDRDWAFKHRVIGLVHDADGPARQLSADLILSDLRRGFFIHAGTP